MHAFLCVQCKSQTLGLIHNMYQSQSETYVCMTLSQVNSGNMMSSTIQLTIPEIKLDQTGDIFGPFQSLEKTLTPKV